MATVRPTSTPLTTRWSFKQGTIESSSPYLPANNLPTEVHLDLLKNHKIADPFRDLNELSVQWIADESWTYRTMFRSPSDHGKTNVKTVLKFQGLDTFASVYLNGKVILQSENMFVEHQVVVSELLYNREVDKTEQENIAENVLEIVFESPRKKGLDLVKQHTEHNFIVHQTEVSRGPVRKAQYHWGWDWGPILLTSGPWKPIFVDTYASRVEDLWLEYSLNEKLTIAKGKIFARSEGQAPRLFFQIHTTLGKCLLDQEGARNDDDTWEVEFEIPIDLWWPRGYGHQHLFTISAHLTSSERGPNSADNIKKKFGFRRIELVQNKDHSGTSFYFRINNIDVFAGGSCWIPADSFASRVKESTYLEWINLIAEGNQSMIRVWGGGIYERDTFYDACDELGILVWQDFMFACANYPAYPSYLNSVELEARQNVHRLRHHPSIVLWCGNNEDYQIVERYNLEYNYSSDKDPESWLKTDFPARYIYEYLLPKIVREETRGVPYHPSSPFGNGTSTTLKVDSTVGDIHQWNVWHGAMMPYQQLPNMSGRFVSEFGMEAYPHLETLEACITQEEHRYPGSMAMDFRNKAIGHERRLISYVAENFRMEYDLPSFAHLTQVMQADAMSWAYKSWRRQWGSHGERYCGGVLVWQLNDCWPTISWAIVDYNLIPKPAYYALKRAMKPVVVGVSRRVNDWTVRPADDLWKRDTSHIDMRKVWEDVQYDVWVASQESIRLLGEIAVRVISIRTGHVLLAFTKHVQIEINGTTNVIQNRKIDLTSFQDGNSPFDISKADPFVIHVSLNIDGKQISSDISWPDPIKYLTFEDRGVSVRCEEDKSKIYVSVQKPTKGFVLDHQKGLKLSDNGFDLVPDETVVVTVRNGGIEKLSWRYVGIRDTSTKP